MKRVTILTALLLAGCGANPQAPSPTEVLFAASASLDQAEVVATAYAQSSVANPAVVAQLKSLDNTAYLAIHPLLGTAKAGGSVVSQAEAEAAQAALTALTNYMLANGVK